MPVSISSHIVHTNNMPSYNESLAQSLRLLYDYSLRFRISIDLLQKLANHLKLDTFIDTELDSSNLRRLSIAGSLLLVDIDFDGLLVTKVTLSLGNHTRDNLELKQLEPADAARYTESSNDGSTTIVTLDFAKGAHISFLKLRDGPDASVAESILMNNLSGETLGNFSSNLKYLANLDSISPPDGDLVVYLDNLALYLAAVHASEIELNGSWKVAAGLANLIGKLALNDTESAQLGVILNFWHDVHEINKQLDDEFGRKYSGLLSIEDAASASVDYLKDATTDTWNLSLADGTTKPYRFTFSGNLHLHGGQSVTGPTGRNWKLVLRLNSPVYMPKDLLDFLGVVDYEVLASPLDEVFSSLIEHSGIEFAKEDGLQISLDLDDYAPYVAVSAFSFARLTQLASIVRALRNHIVFSALLQNLHQRPEFTMSSKGASAEASKKLKQSLKLPNEVTDEELLSLNTISGTSEYLGLQMLPTDSELDSFVQQDDTMMKEDSQESEVQQNRLDFVLRGISYESAECDLALSVSGHHQKGAIEGEFRIDNGIIRLAGDVNMDGDITHQFVRALAVCEDVLLALASLED